MKDKLVVFAFAISSSLVLIGCYEGREHGSAYGDAHPAGYSYDYYPDAQVYFEPQRHVYYWSEGGAWRSGERVPQNVVLRAPVRVELPSREPYKHHDEVRTKYPAHPQDKQPEHGQQDHDGH